MNKFTKNGIPVAPILIHFNVGMPSVHGVDKLIHQSIQEGVDQSDGRLDAIFKALELAMADKAIPKQIGGKNEWQT